METEHKNWMWVRTGSQNSFYKQGKILMDIYF